MRSTVFKSFQKHASNALRGTVTEPNNIACIKLNKSQSDSNTNTDSGNNCNYMRTHKS